jgi:hypothetical protein
MDIENKEDVIASMMREPLLAHRLLFKHRHSHLTPPFHREIIELWHSPASFILIQAFRGAAKSTLAEEALIVQALLRQFHNAIVLGETYERAVERLRAIKHELETNPLLNELFGDQVGPIWSEAKIQLNNGAIIQAFGRGQSLRGSKHLDHRPDIAFADDIENEDSTISPEAIEKTKTWLMATVLPALEPQSRVRVNGTPLHPRSVICQLAADPGWVTRTYPISYLDPLTSLETPTWPDRFDLADIARKRADYSRLGMAHTFAQEFMCQAEDPASKPFTDAFIRVEPTVRTWQAVYAMCDPARTTTRTSASTGFAVWSWLSNRLIVWDAFAGFWQPDQIVSEIFKIDALYAPVAIGIERDGLEEFILQPLRHEQVKRGVSIPIRPLRAPVGKLSFITGLQPYFKAGEVIFAKECPQAREQFLNFPSGRIDIPNALAYALTLRPGQPVYDAFNSTHIVDDLTARPRTTTWCALNSDGRCTTAVLVQLVDGALHILADRAREGEPSAWLGDILVELRLEAAGAPMRLLVPPLHYNQFSPVGLRAALRSLPAECTRGGDPAAGRAAITSQLNRLAHGRPALQISTSARWTLNAFAGGYCRELNRQGQLMAEPSINAYVVLLTGLESFAAASRLLGEEEEGAERHYAFTGDGRKYLTSRPAPGTLDHGRR